MSEGPYRVVEAEGGYDIVPILIQITFRKRNQAEQWCEGFNAAYAAGLAASPTPPPTGNRPWERLEVQGPMRDGGHRLVGHNSGGSSYVIADFPATHEGRSADALADAYNAHRPTPSTRPFVDEGTPIPENRRDAIADAIRKVRGA